MQKPRLLLVNPWIADFTAFDLWSKPLGLLYIARFLQRYDYEVEVLDFTDRGRWGGQESPRYNDGRGKYHKTIIAKPALYHNFPRHFGLYGAKPAQIEEYLQQTEPPDALLVTSLISYWYPGVQATVKLLRRYFPGVPLILGGIYATLFPEHARVVIQPDYLITGYGEKPVLRLLDALFHRELDYALIPPFDDSGGLPWEFYPQLQAVTLLTSRGCPYRCNYCGSRLLHPRFIPRPPEEIVKEIEWLYTMRGVKHFAFYDDALFFRRDAHIIPILTGLLKQDLALNLHAPNGLFAREINQKLADLMFAVGFKTIRLSLESSDPTIQAKSSSKVSNDAFLTALMHLERAGYKRSQIEVYLIMGLPGQSIEQIQASIDFVAANGAITRLASFSPIPGTEAWREALAQQLIPPDCDPLLTNATLFPFGKRGLNYDDYLALRSYANQKNALIRRTPSAPTYEE